MPSLSTQLVDGNGVLGFVVLLVIPVLAVLTAARDFCLPNDLVPTVADIQRAP